MIIGVRHAPVELSMGGKCYGVTDVGTQLSHGEAAAEASRSLRAFGGEELRFDYVWSSDLSRCEGLARALLPSLAAAVELCVDVRLRELNHGSFEGRAWDEIHGSEPESLTRWGERWETEGPPGGESAAALQRRVGAWIDELDLSKRHLLVGHAGPMRAIRVLQRGLDWPAAMTTGVPHLEAVQLSS